MSLSQLQIHHLRNIVSWRLTLNPRFNFFIGANGSGKTSLLESLYLLGTGHSFRTREIAPLIHHEHDALTVFAKTSTQDTLSIQKSRTGPTVVRLNQQFCQSSSELARFLPCQVIYQDIFQIIDSGSTVRRGLLDWGVFHVKPLYHGLWQDYRRALRQRNALLRQGKDQRQILPWNMLLADLGTQLHEFRQAYFYQLAQLFNEVLGMLTEIQCNIHYEKGWDKKNSGQSLMSILEQQFHQDQERQTTLYGPHRADIVFEITGPGKARQLLSRGQQKIILIALKLAQAKLLTQPCTFLLDDIAAELDEGHLQRLLCCLGNTPGQFFITAIHASLLRLFDQSGDHEVFYLPEDEKLVSRETAR